MMKTASKSKGFTLAELLIALAILGVIATFTIPKILDSSTNGKLTSIAKETASMISGAFSTYKQNATPAYNMMATPTNLTDYMNYVRIDTATTAGAFQTPAAGTNITSSCSVAATPCVVLHNGAYLQYDTGATFGATDPAPNNPAATTVIPFNVDPDGTGAQAGAVTFALYYNGRITTAGAATLTAASFNGETINVITTDPSWIANWN
jgi:prepilin-type N-terminal cleavage/methylation domain-containing protein